MAILGKRKRRQPAEVNEKCFREEPRHPYLSGNFAPTSQTCPLTPCSYVGRIPEELLGGQYVRNGSNPVSNEVLGRDAHWFDGDGMLSGVLFRRKSSHGREDESNSSDVQPEFVNQYILTDLYLSASTTEALKKPIVPSITTLVSPFTSIFRLVVSILRSVILVLLSKLPGSPQSIKKISVANTSIMYHDGRALATCESGPPMRVSLPTLDTVGWFNGESAEGEPGYSKSKHVLGGEGLLSFMKEWTTAHPKVDPQTNEMILFHSTFVAPFVHYSVIPASRTSSDSTTTNTSNTGSKRLLNSPVPGIKSAKMMHDFGVSSRHTVIMDLPLSLDPLMTLKGKPPITYEPSKSSRFGVFPRHAPWEVKWFETAGCCIFHTANTWDTYDEGGCLQTIDMLACRMTSASVIFNAGNITVPEGQGLATSRKATPELPVEHGSRKRAGTHSTRYGRGPTIESHLDEQTPLLPKDLKESEGRYGDASRCSANEAEEMDQCRLYYFSFDMEPCSHLKVSDEAEARPQIKHQFALSKIPFEFPSVRDDRSMSSARYVYGCTTSSGSFNPALGRTSKIDALVKFDARHLINKGKRMVQGHSTTSLQNASRSGSYSKGSNLDVVDARSVSEILAEQEQRDAADATTTGRGGDARGNTNMVIDRMAIQIFKTPPHICAQEPRFVPAAGKRRNSRRKDGEAKMNNATACLSHRRPCGRPSECSCRDDNDRSISGLAIDQDSSNTCCCPQEGYQDIDEDEDEHEDAGFLLSYMFDEAQLGANGEAPPSALSELWIIDARTMTHVLARVILPQRVPYGLHGSWFSEAQVLGQRPVAALRQQQQQQQPQQQRYQWRLGGHRRSNEGEQGGRGAVAAGVVARASRRFAEGVVWAMGG